MIKINLLKDRLGLKGYLKVKKTISGYFWHITDFHLDTNFSSNDNGKQFDTRQYFIGDYAYDVCWGGKAQGKALKRLIGKILD